jgi:hypothetical protein
MLYVTEKITVFLDVSAKVDRVRANADVETCGNSAPMVINVSHPSSDSQNSQFPSRLTSSARFCINFSSILSNSPLFDCPYNYML